MRKNLIDSATVRKLLEAHGSCRTQSADEWTGSIPLPEAIARFYTEVGPESITIKGYGNPFYIPSLSELWSNQAGYRWNGVSDECLDDWNQDWIVVADQGADPYIFSTGRVLFAYHGEGVWNPREVYPDLNTMAACIATLGSVIVEAHNDFTDDDCLIRPIYREDAVTRLTKLLSDSAVAESIVDIAGWG